MMAQGPAIEADGDFGNRGGRPSFQDKPAFGVVEFDELTEMIGDDGVMEMVEIFQTETRLRLRRLTAGDQDLATQMREVHTLKGAAGTVAAPRLTAIGHALEDAARNGIAPTHEDINSIEPALEAYLTAVRSWARSREFVS